MDSHQLRLLPDPPPEEPRQATGIEARTYIYFNKEGELVHCNAIGGFIGQEYKHEDPEWQPPADWPYEIKDFRKGG